MEDGKVMLFDLNSVPRTIISGGHASGVLAWRSTPAARLASASHDKTVKIWDAESAGWLSRWPDTTMVMATSADDQTLASAGVDRTIRLWRRRANAMRNNVLFMLEEKNRWL